jgi:hypothetical protein
MLLMLLAGSLTADSSSSGSSSKASAFESQYAVPGSAVVRLAVSQGRGSDWVPKLTDFGRVGASWASKKNVSSRWVASVTSNTCKTKEEEEGANSRTAWSVVCL